MAFGCKLLPNTILRRAWKMQLSCLYQNSAFAAALCHNKKARFPPFTVQVSLITSATKKTGTAFQVKAYESSRFIRNPLRPLCEYVLS